MEQKVEETLPPAGQYVKSILMYSQNKTLQQHWKLKNDQVTVFLYLINLKLT